MEYTPDFGDYNLISLDGYNVPVHKYILEGFEFFQKVFQEYDEYYSEFKKDILESCLEFIYKKDKLSDPCKYSSDYYELAKCYHVYFNKVHTKIKKKLNEHIPGRLCKKLNIKELEKIYYMYEIYTLHKVQYDDVHYFNWDKIDFSKVDRFIKNINEVYINCPTYRDIHGIKPLTNFPSSFIVNNYKKLAKIYKVSDINLVYLSKHNRIGFSIINHNGNLIIASDKVINFDKDTQLFNKYIENDSVTYFLYNLNDPALNFIVPEDNVIVKVSDDELYDANIIEVGNANIIFSLNTVIPDEKMNITLIKILGRITCLKN